MSKSLCEKRKTAMAKYFRKWKKMPTYDEMARILGLKSKGSLHKYVRKFIEEGIMKKSSTGSLMATSKLYGVHLLGDIKAGFPSPAEEELSDTISLDEYLIERPTSTYILKVSGDSMIDAGIMPEDLVIVDRGETPKHGDIVVAEIDHEWTLKYLIKTGKKVLLRAGNERYKDIEPNEELRIAGVVKGAVRKY